MDVYQDARWKQEESYQSHHSLSFSLPKGWRSSRLKEKNTQLMRSVALFSSWYNPVFVFLLYTAASLQTSQTSQIALLLKFPGRIKARNLTETGRNVTNYHPCLCPVAVYQEGCVSVLQETHTHTHTHQLACCLTLYAAHYCVMQSSKQWNILCV